MNIISAHENHLFGKKSVLKEESKAKKEADRKYNRDALDKVKRRVNISTKIKQAVATIISNLYAECPSASGYGRRVGITYRIFGKSNSAVIRVGNAAPYLVHLSYPVTKRPTEHANWITTAVLNSVNEVTDLGFEIQEPLVSYGRTIIELYDAEGGI
jgi:hypothetical protein